MNNSSLRQLVNLGDHVRKLFRSTFVIFDLFQVTDSITGCFSVVLVPFPAFSSLTYIFLGSLVILPFRSKILRRQK